MPNRLWIVAGILILAILGNGIAALNLSHQRPQVHLVAVRHIAEDEPFSDKNVAVEIGWATGSLAAYQRTQQVVGELAARQLRPGAVITPADVKPAARSGRDTSISGSGELDLVRSPVARWVQLIPPNAACGSLTSGTSKGGPKLGSCFPKLLVRVIFEGNRDCKEVAFRPGIHVSLRMESRSNPSQQAFPITLCEGETEYADRAVLFPDGKEIAWEGLDQLQRIAVVGDTGCDNGKGVGQDCSKPQTWPFRDVALAATGVPGGSPAPGLVIHVGDYRYRTSTTGVSDNWWNWYKDFFQPAESLLLAAPWIMLRGNHENCFGENGNGWFFLLQPEFKTVSLCSNDADRDPDNQPPYALDLTAGKELRLIIVDSANAKYRCDTWVRDFRRRSEMRVREYLNMGSGVGTAWLLSHYPVWNVAEDYLSDDNGHNNVIRCTSAFEVKPTVFRYREVMSGIVEAGVKSGFLQAIVSGDTHNFQVLRVHELTADATGLVAGSHRPLQVIAGNGGTKLDPALGPRNREENLAHTCDQRDRMAFFQREIADSSGARRIVGKAVCSYGFVDGERTGDEWTFSLHPFGGATKGSQTSCEIESADPTCYHPPDSKDCILLTNKPPNGGANHCLPLR